MAAKRASKTSKPIGFLASARNQRKCFVPGYMREYPRTTSRLSRCKCEPCVNMRRSASARDRCRAGLAAGPLGPVTRRSGRYLERTRRTGRQLRIARRSTGSDNADGARHGRLTTHNGCRGRQRDRSTDRHLYWAPAGSHQRWLGAIDALSGHLTSLTPDVISRSSCFLYCRHLAESPELQPRSNSVTAGQSRPGLARRPCLPSRS
jgi:hypothetical protein